MADDPASLYREGLRLYSSGQASGAIEAFQRSLAIRPGDAATWKALGVVYASRNEYALAEQPFHRACLLDAKLTDACLYFGRTLYLLDRFGEAVNVLDALMESEPRNPQAFRIKALALEGLGKMNDAEAAFRKAMDLDGGSAPNDDPAIDYGVFLYRLGRTANALPPLESAVKRHPDAARARLELGCLLLELERDAEAAAQLERATTLDPQLPRGHLLLGKAYQRLGRTELARKELDQGSRTVK